ncbi:MAG TPA: GNAT family N-acetyltransferase [Pyrinomonadaceae bacterium]|nr:GNAT family N-acetyltransferase [Pyrinomonadaceae bacterium]
MNSATEKTSIEIRDIESATEYRLVEQLQKEVWGVQDLDVVPLSQLVAAKIAGGVLLGAFDDGKLVGFVYGFVGYERGAMVHHSHMLAVRPEYRDHNLGFLLKAAQCERVLAQGIEIMTWTFDPLQSRNAHFNFNKLGVISDQYYVNFYGEDASSFLHRNGTDRLWVTWPLTSDRVRMKLGKTYSVGPTARFPALVELDENDRPHCNEIEKLLEGEGVLIEIPTNIRTLESDDFHLASEWRAVTRRAFTEALAAGFVVEDFYRMGLSSCQIGAYVLTRPSDR